MTEQATLPRGRWLLAFVGALGVVGALAVLFRIPPPRQAGKAVHVEAPQPLHVARPDDRNLLLKQETELRDLRPLFLPTERNAALPEPQLEPGRTFLDSENLKLTFSDADVQVSHDLPPVVFMNRKPLRFAEPADVFGVEASRFDLLGLGRRPAPPTQPAPRAAYLEVVALKDGVRVMGLELPPEAKAPGSRPWSPIELMAVADAAGLASPLVVTEGSRVEEVDSHFKNYLERQFKIGARLDPGIYRIVVAP